MFYENLNKWKGYTVIPHEEGKKKKECEQRSVETKMHVRGCVRDCVLIVVFLALLVWK